MQISAKELSQLLDGTVVGDPDILVDRPSKIEEATQGSICFYANPKYESYVYSTQASVILVNKDFKPAQPLEATLIKVDDVYGSVTCLLETFGKKEKKQATISSQTCIHPTASLGDNIEIGAFVVIEEGAKVGNSCIIHPQVFIGKNVTIGKDVTLHAGVKIYHDCVIGDHCTLHANAVIGGDGFGYAPQEDGSFKKIPQLGNVVLENKVEIGANTTIDRATMGSTIIREGVKLDNLIMIAHNVEVGKNTAIAAQTGIAGSTKIGEQCMLGGQVGIAGHLNIANKVKFQAGSGVSKSIKKEGASMYGYPAIPYFDYLRSYTVFKRLPELEKEIARLKKQLEG